MSNIRQQMDIFLKFQKMHRNEGTMHTEVSIGGKQLSKQTQEWLENYGQAIQIYTKKIDVIWENNGITIIEIKRTCDTKSLGQLLCYKYLYAREKNMREEDIKLAVVCRYTDPIIAPVMEHYNIKIYQV